MLQVIVITKDNGDGKPRYCRIGDNFDRSSWYNLKNFPELPFKKGDAVDIKFEKETINNKVENVLTEVKVITKAEEIKSTVQQKVVDNKQNNNGKEWRRMSHEESEGIRKQAVGKMVAETLKAMELKGHGIVDVIPIIKDLFKTYEELTK